MSHSFLHTGEAILGGFLVVSSSGAQTPDQNLHGWQVRRLMQPSATELKKEHGGSVYIYDGLAEHEVDLALDAHFERIEHMMFIGTVRAGPDGGTVLESDGCSGSE